MEVFCYQYIFVWPGCGFATLDAMICDRWLLKTYLARTNFGPFIPLVSCTAPWPEKPGRTELCSWLQRKPSPREPLQRLKVWSMTPSTPWSSMAAKQQTFSFCVDWKVWERNILDHIMIMIGLKWIGQDSLIACDWMPQIVDRSYFFILIVALGRDVPKIELLHWAGSWRTIRARTIFWLR